MTLTQGVPPTGRTLSHQHRGQASAPDKSSESCALGNPTYPRCDPSRRTLAEEIDATLKPAPSQQPAAAPFLARERRLRWIRPEAKQLPWLRERFHRIQDPPPVLDGRIHAVTLDAAGRPVRTFSASATSLEDYADQWGTWAWCGPLTCPREAVAPQTIRCGAASRPAHQVLGHMLAAGLTLADVYPLCFINGNQYLGFSSLNGRRDHAL